MMDDQIDKINKEIKEFNKKWEGKFSFFQPVTLIDCYNVKDEVFLKLLIEVKTKIIKDTEVLFSELLDDYEFNSLNNS